MGVLKQTPDRLKYQSKSPLVKIYQVRRVWRWTKHLKILNLSNGSFFFPTPQFGPSLRTDETTYHITSVMLLKASEPRLLVAELRSTSHNLSGNTDTSAEI